MSRVSKQLGYYRVTYSSEYDELHVVNGDDEDDVRDFMVFDEETLVEMLNFLKENRC